MTFYNQGQKRSDARYGALDFELDIPWRVCYGLESAKQETILSHDPHARSLRAPFAIFMILVASSRRFSQTLRLDRWHHLLPDRTVHYQRPPNIGTSRHPLEVSAA